MKFFLRFLLIAAFTCTPVFASAADNRMAGSVPVAQKKAKATPVKAAAPAKTMSPVVKAEKKAEELLEKKVQEADAKAKKAVIEDDADAQPRPMRAVSGPINYVGQIKTYKARTDDTLLTIGERFGLGYVELRSANPQIDPWRPGAGTFVVLPTMHLLPDAPRRGIVVNLSEMRLYHFTKDGVKTYPIGVGREGFSTPVGTTSVTRKQEGPTWTPTDRMRREDPKLPVQVKGMSPENPLGTHALYLGWPQYLLHGTNKPWGIGRRVSSGCVRMYNDDAKTLFESVPVGTPVTVVRQGIKFGWIGDMLYVEAHPDDVLADQVERVGETQDYKVPADIFENLGRAAGKARDRLDWKAVREALKERRGYPVPILMNAGEDHRFVTASMEARAGTSRFGPRLTNEVVQPSAQTVQAQPASATRTEPRRRSHEFNG